MKSFLKCITNKIFNRKETLLYFTPHQDDELLTMGIDICYSLERGADVHVILCTDGSSSSVKKTLSNGEICEKHQGKHIYNLSEEEFIKARDYEFTNSCIAMGIKEVNIHIPDIRAKDGNLTIEQAEDIIKNFLNRYNRNTTICTIYFNTGEKQHIDHKNIGIAAYNLYEKNIINKVKFFKEPYCNWGITNKPVFVKAKQTIEEKIKNAIKEYSIWSPKHNRYAIGYHSVPNEINNLRVNMQTEYFIMRKH